MSNLPERSDITQRELARGRRLTTAAVAAPLVLAGVPAVVFTTLLFVFGVTPPIAATFFFLGLIFTILGFVIGLGFSGFFAYRRSNWSQEMRERMAARGIRAEEVDWFRREMKPSERQTLKLVAARDPLLADAYQETLASRLTATRIVKSSKRELMLMQRLHNKLKYFKTDSAKTFREELDKDVEKIRSINNDAREMLAE